MPGPRGLVQQLDQGLHRNRLLPRKAKLLVAVSGGADSVALLRLLVEINRSAYWGWKLVVGHVDHGLRGRASRGDARFVAALAKKLGLPYVGKRLHLKRQADGRCSEDAARQGRFKALGEMVRSQRCIGVVMAHHADDQAETVLMRMFRGCGLDGLAGMAGESNIAGMRVFRPLLDIRRKVMRDYLQSIGQDWREDESNASEQYLRNRVRRNLMPLVEILWPRAVEALGRLAILACEAQGVVVSAAESLRLEYPYTLHLGCLEMSRAAFWDAPPSVASEMLRQIIADVGGSPETADFERIRAAVRILRDFHGGKRIEMGSGVAVVLPGRASGMVQVEGPSQKGRRIK